MKPQRAAQMQKQRAQKPTALQKPPLTAQDSPQTAQKARIPGMALQRERRNSSAMSAVGLLVQPMPCQHIPGCISSRRAAG